MAYAVTVLQKWGFEVRKGKTVGERKTYLSGTDEERLADLQAMLDDPQINAILMGRGGYGMSRILDSLDFSGFLKHPKWICGFSDFTILHNHLQTRYGARSLHSPMCGAFKPETEEAEYIHYVRKALTGAELTYNFPSSPHNRTGKAEAVLTGGNLALLDHATGSVSEVDTDGKILFIEDIGEYLYRIDRMLLGLKRAGKLDKLAGLIVGSFTELEDTDRPFGMTVEEMITEKVAAYDYPVCFNFPAGHQEVNYPFILGAMHLLEVTESGSVLRHIPMS